MSDGGNGRVVLGIHSQVSPHTEGSFNQLIDGHAWISVTRSGRTEYYGLWPDTHPRGLDNGAGSDIRRGIESEPGFNPSASRYYELTPEQVTQLETRLRENVTWGYGNTCASWASDTVGRVTGQTVSGSELLGLTDTPRELVQSIRELERARPTSPDNPITPAEVPARSSSFGALDPDDPLVRQAEVAIRAERVRVGLPDADTTGEVAFAVRLARENGLQGIAEIRYPDAPEGNVFLRGTGNDPGARAHASLREFTQTPAEATLAALGAAVGAQRAQEALQAVEVERIAPRAITA
jgi:hypothetical protein